MVYLTSPFIRWRLGNRNRTCITRGFYACFTLMAGIILLSCLHSCAEDASDVAFIGELEVTGTVYDDNSDSGVGDMMVILSSYESDDINFKFPIARDTSYTDDSGFFSIRTRAMSEGWTFRLAVKDNMPSRPGGQYRLTSRFDPILHIEFGKHMIDSEGVYRMDNIPVPVTRE